MYINRFEAHFMKASRNIINNYLEIKPVTLMNTYN